MPVIPTTLQPACGARGLSAREGTRGPLMTTMVPPSSTASPASRAARTTTGRPRGQYGSANPTWTTAPSSS